MRTSSNPAFRSLPTGGANLQMGGAAARYAGFETQTATGVERPMTVDDVVTKTGACVGTALVTGVVTAWWANDLILSGASAGPVYLALIGGFIGGLILSLIVIFKQLPNAKLILGYSALEGVALGAFTAVIPAVFGVAHKVAPIALNAILGTAGVFIGMLVIYKTGAIRVTPKLTKWIIGAAVGVGILMLVNLVMYLFGSSLGIRDGGPLAILFSLVCIGIAAFMFLLDFDMADNMIRTGMPQKWAWYAAFGLMTTLVWLYIEMVRLVTYFYSE